MARNLQRGVKLNSGKSIARGNILINNGYGFSLSSYSDWRGQSINNRIYHNTLYKNYNGLKANSDYPAVLNIFKNNIFYHNREHEIYVAGPTGNYFINNNILGGLVAYGNGDIQEDNRSLNPQFINEVSDPDTSGSDLHLQPASPMIDAGAFLTETMNSGSGTAIPVEDARYFMDGWGIIEGDLIQLEGETQKVRITHVDYDNNTITVDSNISWNQGQGVSLAYEGSAPDIGAYEYE
jgi:hypothetical protein